MYNIPLVKNMLVEELLSLKTHKGIENLPVESTTVRSAAMFMKAKKISAVVFYKDGKPMGIMTERDVSNAMADYDNAGQLPVKDVMTLWEKIKPMRLRQTIGEAEKEMIENGHRHGFAVNDKGELVGVFSQRDINDLHYRHEELIEIQRQ